MPASAPLAEAVSLPATEPTSEPIEEPQPASDPWSGAELVIEPPRPIPIVQGTRSPGAAQAMAWASFGGGALLALGGGSTLLGRDFGEPLTPGIVMLSGGGLLLVVGPVLGHVYAGEIDTALKQAGIAGAVIGGSVAVALAARFATAPLEDEPLRITLSLLPLTFGGAFALHYAVRMAEDAPEAVRRMNQKRVQAKLLPTPGGVALWGEF